MRRPKACPFRRSDGTYWARVRYVDESGKTRDKVARAESLADADAKSIELVKKYDKYGDSQPPPITFNKFAESFIPHIQGQRSYKTSLGFLRTLRDHFGNKRLTAITYKDIEAYAKERRKSVSSRTGKRLKRASVNREIALLSSMFKQAIEQGFATKNPYKDGPPLIKPEQETKRNRVLSEEEEKRLLAACTGRRAHLRPIIVAALDTGATKSQLLRLTWRDVHIGLRTIGFRLRKGIANVRMGEDLTSALANLRREREDEWYNTPSLRSGEDAPLLEDWIKPQSIFRDFKTAFSTVCRDAKIKDLRFNDLRYTVKTRNEAKIKRFKELITRPTE
jgi:integrase